MIPYDVHFVLMLKENPKFSIWIHTGFYTDYCNILQFSKAEVDGANKSKSKKYDSYFEIHVKLRRKEKYTKKLLIKDDEANVDENADVSLETNKPVEKKKNMLTILSRVSSTMVVIKTTLNHNPEKVDAKFLYQFLHVWYTFILTLVSF